MRALKLLVIALGVLLLAGIGALAAAVVWRINHSNPTSPAQAVPSAAQRIVLPPGAKVVVTDVDAGRLIVRVDIPGNGVRLLVFDLATGAEITTIELIPASP